MGRRKQIVPKKSDNLEEDQEDPTKKSKQQNNNSVQDAEGMLRHFFSLVPLPIVHSSYIHSVICHSRFDFIYNIKISSSLCVEELRW